MKIILRSIILLVVFVVAFLSTTVFFDTIERHNGYYNQGIAESNEVGK
jgi:hypothetical protein